MVAAASAPLPSYPGVDVVTVGSSTADAQGRTLAYFVTDDPLPAVARYFAQRWALDGVPTMVSGDMVEVCAVSAVWTVEAELTQVTLSRQRGRTLGLLVRQSLAPRDRPHERPPEGGFQPRATLVSLPVAEVQRQLESALGQAHFRPVQVSRTPKGVSLSHARGTERRFTFLASVAADLTAMVESRWEEP
jgi:hypothetical protein